MHTDKLTDGVAAILFRTRNDMRAMMRLASPVAISLECGSVVRESVMQVCIPIEQAWREAMQ